MPFKAWQECFAEYGKSLDETGQDLKELDEVLARLGEQLSLCGQNKREKSASTVSRRPKLMFETYNYLGDHVVT